MLAYKIPRLKVLGLHAHGETLWKEFNPSHSAHVPCHVDEQEGKNVNFLFCVRLQLRIIRLVGMMLAVYVKRTLKNHIKDVAAEHVGTGIMGKMVCSH